MGVTEDTEQDSFSFRPGWVGGTTNEQLQMNLRIIGSAIGFLCSPIHLYIDKRGTKQQRPQ